MGCHFTHRMWLGIRQPNISSCIIRSVAFVN